MKWYKDIKGNWISYVYDYDNIIVKLDKELYFIDSVQFEVAQKVLANRTESTASVLIRLKALYKAKRESASPVVQWRVFKDREVLESWIEANRDRTAEMLYKEKENDLE